MKTIKQLISNQAKEIIDKNQVPSISIFVQKNNEIIINEAFGYSNINPISLSEESKAQIASPYVIKKGYFLELKPVKVKYFPTGEAYFTLNDYARFMKMHMNKGMHENKRIIQKETIALMHQNQTAGLDDGIYGYGCIWLADRLNLRVCC